MLLGRAGTCTGECRRVINSTTSDPTAPTVSQTCHGHGCGAQDVFTIDAPFTYPLDATSHITILPFTGQIAFNNNDYSDGASYMMFLLPEHFYAGCMQLLTHSPGYRCCFH